ncbi:phage tail protein [Pseudomonas aeruginosa]|jgi:hypothetical protein|nr:phage tail protein [Pseudomonas aeruginosa]OPE02901.1 phage tail protein [Pseudomonas aeruginosa]OPE36482.1 phage tail protein [Pseudomonas aeruginosa]OWI52708.1 phage tail protein [Pseudomonas aeruginosa]OWI65525.1 phage tail protein [Pseudomonas aeruginosa]
MADVRPTKLQNDGNGYGSLREFADGDTVPVALGGTGAPTAAGARASLGLGSAAVRSALGSTGALYSRDSILGSVSQSSGVPTGAVIQRGSNANGEFVRFADGTQICIRQIAGSGSNYPAGAHTVQMPAAFVGGSLFGGSFTWIPSNNWPTSQCAVRGAYYGGQDATFYLNEDLGSNGLYILVIGRWF